MEVNTLNKLERKIQSSDTKTSGTKNYNTTECKSKRSTPNGGGYGLGKRKNSIARVWVKPGQGKIIVNCQDLTEYFSRESYRNIIKKPFICTGTSTQYDVVSTAKGGGTTGQAGAIVHGIARALDCISDSFHSILKKNGFLTRDSRVVERKKYGKRKARKSTQFSKR